MSCMHYNVSRKVKGEKTCFLVKSGNIPPFVEAFPFSVNSGKLKQVEFRHGGKFELFFFYFVWFVHKRSRVVSCLPLALLIFFFLWGGEEAYCEWGRCFVSPTSVGPLVESARPVLNWVLRRRE